MSTTFHVYPRTRKTPSFTEVLRLTEFRLRAFLQEFGIAHEPSVHVTLRQQDPAILLPLELDAPARWSDEQYAFFTVPPDTGGTDACCLELDDFDREMWRKRIRTETRARFRKELIRECLRNGYYWNFRRSAGQGAVISLTYGMVAASFAELTDGFIDSIDCAWDEKRWPAKAGEFDRWYFKPGRAIEPDFRNWSEQCIAVLREKWLGEHS